MELEKDMGSRMGNPESDRRVYFCAFPSVALYLVPFNIRVLIILFMRAIFPLSGEYVRKT